MRLFPIVFAFCVVGLTSSTAEPDAGLPVGLQSLKDNYDAAIQRSVEPLRQKYVEELKRRAVELKEAGDDDAAAMAASMLEVAEQPIVVPSGPKTKSGVEAFKDWLSTVTIEEEEGFNMIYRWDGEVLTSIKNGGPPRRHEDANITENKILVPFTNTNATITVNEARTQAEVVYSTGVRTGTVITPK